ncbi:MAG: (d)CMP kinase [Deltaproteobacteria bacterium]
MIIAVDGPAGAGKSTVAKILAKRLGLLYIDTGAMYRALTFKALETGTDINDEKAMEELAKGSVIDLNNGPEGLKVSIDGRDVTQAIREPRVSARVSDVARIAGVRYVMAGLQRRLGHSHDSILDGRDIGTVVFPKADYKFFIDASPGERVNRRFKDFKDLKIDNVSREQVEKDLANRDKIDSTRACAPLKKADDAIYIDTTALGIDQVVDKMLSYIKKDRK